MMQSYETVFDIDNASGLLGTTYVKKSMSADSTVRPWSFIGNGTFFHLFIHYATTVAGLGPESECGWYAWGDGIPSTGESEFTVMLGGRDGYSNATADVSYAGFMQNPAATTGTGASYCQVSRNNAGDSTAYNFGFIPNGGPGRQEAVMGGAGPVYPYKGRLMYARPYVPDSVVYDIRGYVPGVYNPIISSTSSGLSNKLVVTQGTVSLMLFRIRISTNCGVANSVYLGWVGIDIGEGFKP